MEWYHADIMHDVLEGTLQLHIKYLLKYLILEENLFSLSLLNDRIQSFLYGSADTCNKPTIISNDTLMSSGNCLKQSCKQLHYLLIPYNRLFKGPLFQRTLLVRKLNSQNYFKQKCIRKLNKLQNLFVTNCTKISASNITCHTVYCYALL